MAVLLYGPGLATAIVGAVCVGLGVAHGWWERPLWRRLTIAWAVALGLWLLAAGCWAVLSSVTVTQP